MVVGAGGHLLWYLLIWKAGSPAEDEEGFEARGGGVEAGMSWKNMA